MKNPIEKFLEGFSRGRNPPLEQGRSVRHPPLEEEGAAEPAAPIPYPAVRKEAEEARSDSEPRTKSGAEGRLLDISFELLIVPRQVSFEEESQNPPAVGHWKPLMPSKGDKEEPEGGCQDAGGVDEPQSTEQLNVSRLRSSSVEIREKGSEFLRDELHKAQKELKLKDKECERLSKVREQLEQELEELTASLFEEAHKMVREANTKQAAAEKQLREARGKIDMLQAEVTALKTLVITSTPSSPNRELHPQLQSPSKAGFRKGHGRNKSTSSAMVSAASQNVAPEPVSRECKESGFPALLSLLLCILPGKAIHITYEPGWQALGADASSSSSSSSRQVDSILFAEFQTWKESPTLDKSCSFLDRIYREDVGPCLDFTKQELSELVRVAVEQNTLTIEPVASQTVPMGKVAAEECGGPNGFRSQIVTKCALSGLPRTCKHRIMLGDSGNYYYISPSCRARITAVCNFFTYIRYIQQGLVRQDVELMYWEVMRLRREMSLAKLGFYPSEIV
ncbi:PREDICTED: guanine nucleotide exchange factor for Rab-3A isoform X5 [Corvus brachyrhynchos]|uniref:guanine nucleotide exchange factor for Rab-3A isoform X5 n=1 Tax=Corvus brachyrhynchos TaxID=85066 RepID=UPI000816446A|nr:PREDICTED: guanine nucleotide exchange factor for Rab-3A isoform X5 [Corvus brachyrhynchos]